MLTFYFCSFSFNWRIIALQPCAGFCSTATRIHRQYTHAPALWSPPPSSPSHPSRSPQGTGLNSLWYIAASHLTLLFTRPCALASLLCLLWEVAVHLCSSCCRHVPVPGPFAFPLGSVGSFLPPASSLGKPRLRERCYIVMEVICRVQMHCIPWGISILGGPRQCWGW